MSETESETENKPEPSSIVKFLRSDTILGLLIAAFSVLIAYVGYQATLIDGKSSEFELNAGRILSSANREYLAASQQIASDMRAYDDYFAATDEELADNYYSSLSEALIENMESEDPAREFLFDDIYLGEMYQISESCFVEADDMFILSNDVGDIADKHQLVMFTFAIGLALTAWASLLPEESSIRLVFVIFSLIVLVVGLILYLPLATSATGFPADTAAIGLTCLK